jgi:hypothetical protein
MKRVVMILCLLAATPSVRADDFDRLEGPALAGLAENPDAKASERLTLRDLGNQTNVLKGIRTPLVCVKTDSGNLARLLVSAGFRKSLTNKEELLPILVIERFDTLEAGPARSRIARGRDVILFDGFNFDLDTGTVVPEGQGGDVAFVAKGENAPALVASKGSTLYTLTKSPLGALPAGSLTAGRGVSPADFNGRFHLVADGQWSGLLEISVDGDGAVGGRFLSEQTGGSYKITGELAADAPNQILISVELPRSRLEFDGRLWTDGKGAIAGTVTLLDRVYGFVAVREGGRLLPEGDLNANDAAQGSVDDRAVLVVTPTESRLDDQPVLLADLAKRIAEKKVRRLTIRAVEAIPFSTISDFIKAAKDAGVESIRLSSPDSASP